MPVWTRRSRADAASSPLDRVRAARAAGRRQHRAPTARSMPAQASAGRDATNATVVARTRSPAHPPLPVGAAPAPRTRARADHRQTRRSPLHRRPHGCQPFARGVWSHARFDAELPSSERRVEDCGRVVGVRGGHVRAAIKERPLKLAPTVRCNLRLNRNDPSRDGVTQRG